MELLELDVKKSALILIDLQHAIVGRTLAPHSAESVVKTAASLAEQCRIRGVLVVYVRVDLANMVTVPADSPPRDPKAPPPPPQASEIVPEAGMQPGDLRIIKPHWDAFIKTDLEKILRERGIDTILLGGIATNFGVESTARSAAGLGFSVVIIEDAMTSASAEAHQFAIKNVFPRIARVRSSKEVTEAIEAGSKNPDY